jgi:sugar phosphate isomerase/epimerase
MDEDRSRKGNSRRHFLKTSGLISASLLSYGGFSILAAGSCDSGETNAASKSEKDMATDPVPFGIQLWTLRDDFPEKPVEISKQLAGFGYRQIETFENEQGMFCGMQAAEMKALMDDVGLQLVSAHCNVMDNFRHKVEQAAEAGVQYLVVPYLGPQNQLDDYRRYAALFNEKGRICRDAGIGFAYHNHEYSFMPHPGTDMLPQTILMDETDPELVDFEMDIYWVVTAGQDPAGWMRNYPGRFKLGHVKDRASVDPEVMRASTTLGKGVINYEQLLPVARENGMQKFFVEQEEYEGSTPLAAARDGAAYMTSMPGFRK